VDKAALINALAKVLPQKLCEELVNEFVELRKDVATSTLGRSPAGKIVETVVQIMQQLENGQYDQQPNIEGYLKNVESRPSQLDDGLRICGARIARSMYALRSKRNILHKGNVDPNTHDLRFLLHGTQWLIAELLRNVSGLTMQESGQLVNLVHAPIGGLIDDTGFRRLVQHPGEASDEILILLHSHYGTVTNIDTIFQSLNRRTQKQVRNALASLWRRKLIDGSPKEGYVLTGKGFDTAVKLQTQPQGEPKKKSRR
jgi:hypothetical protein